LYAFETDKKREKESARAAAWPVFQKAYPYEYTVLSHSFRCFVFSIFDRRLSATMGRKE
jgi:hypothetical protein